MFPAQFPSTHSTEAARVAALESLRILGTPPEEEFDYLTLMAARAFGTKSAAISLVDNHRQWFKSRYGISFSETPRSISFCSHALEQGHPLVVLDASKDPIFGKNPLSACPGGIRFYAGAPILLSSGYAIGTFCVFDNTPRASMSKLELDELTAFARMTARLIDAGYQRHIGSIAGGVIDATADGVLCTNIRGEILFWNRACERMFGKSAEHTLGQSLNLILESPLRGLARKVGKTVELQARHADGDTFPVEVSIARWTSPETNNGFAAVIRDIRDRKRLEAESSHARNFLDSVVSNLPAMLFVKDSETRKYLLVNRAGEQLIGKPANAITGKTDTELFPTYGEGYETRDTEALASSSALSFESEFVRDDGESVHLRTKRIIMDGPDRPRQYIMGMSEDVTEIRRVEAQVLRLAHHDTLTGLLNRGSFVDRLHQLLAARLPLALLSIDLDRFKAVNDQFGHLLGDDVLAQVGDRLRSCVRSTDLVARVGGDEFCVVLLGSNIRERAALAADRIVTRLAEPIMTERATAHTGATVGVSIAPEDAASTADLRQCADLALYRAKEEGRGSVCFYSPQMDAAARDRLSLERDLRKALTGDEIDVLYQPVLCAISGVITSAEALARWTHPSRGPISPEVFIPLAEECGLINELGEAVLRRACADALSWPATMCVAVNLSPLQFLHGNLSERITLLLKETGLPAARLQLEVTEGLLIRDVERTFAELELLRKQGVQVLIDDFGVGYSSLSYFERFQFDKVKIDKSFVSTIATSRAAKAIVQAVTGLGKELLMGIVAEGVETEEQMHILIGAGCTHLQGYLFSKPISSKSIENLFRGDFLRTRFALP